jgi:fructose-specific phosphotransferase system IIC component
MLDTLYHYAAWLDLVAACLVMIIGYAVMWFQSSSNPRRLVRLVATLVCPLVIFTFFCLLSTVINADPMTF